MGIRSILFRRLPEEARQETAQKIRSGRYGRDDRPSSLKQKTRGFWAHANYATGKRTALAGKPALHGEGATRRWRRKCKRWQGQRRQRVSRMRRSCGTAGT